MLELFNLRNINYDFLSQTGLELGPIHTTAYGLRSVRHLLQKSETCQLTTEILIVFQNLQLK